MRSPVDGAADPGAGERGRPGLRRALLEWPASRWAPLILFALGLGVFSATAGRRLLRQSTDPHFIYQADAWLQGRASLAPPPEKGDDPCQVENVLLDDGTEVRGRRLGSNHKTKKKRLFRTTGGDEIPIARIERSLGVTHYVSFPPFPSVLFLPQVALDGRRANDVWPTVLIAALVLPLAFLTLGRLRAAGLSRRTPGEDVWLVLCLVFGSVFFFSAVQGRVWYTAHVVGVALALGYAWASVEARHPIVAGLCLGLAAMTRTPMAFLFPLFALEAWRMSGEEPGRWRRFALRCAWFAAPVAIIAAVGVAYNVARFDDPIEFGHSYLAIKQQAQIEETGLFGLDYLSRNLAVAFTLLPRFSAEAPFVQVGVHGLAIWFTTPILFFLLWPRDRGAWHWPLWLTVAAVALPSLLYHNSGWQQFGYRFSLDYMALLVLLLAIGGRPLGRVARALILLAIVINLFGAVTFARDKRFYRTDDFACVIRH